MAGNVEGAGCDMIDQPRAKRAPVASAAGTSM